MEWQRDWRWTDGLAMQHINFLERKAFDLRNFELNYLWTLLIPTGLILLFLTFAFVQKHRLQGLANQLFALQGEISQLKSSPATASTTPAAIETTRHYLDNAIAWAGLLDDISKNTPQEVKLNRVEGSITDDRKLIVEGVALNLQVVTQFKSRLISLPICDKIAQISSQQLKDAGTPGRLAFQLTCWMR